MDLPVLQTESARDEGVRTIMNKMGYHEISQTTSQRDKAMGSMKEKLKDMEKRKIRSSRHLTGFLRDKKWARSNVWNYKCTFSIVKKYDESQEGNENKFIFKDKS